MKKWKNQICEKRIVSPFFFLLFFSFVSVFFLTVFFFFHFLFLCLDLYFPFFRSFFEVFLFFLNISLFSFFIILSFFHIPSLFLLRVVLRVSYLFVWCCLVSSFHWSGVALFHPPVWWCCLPSHLDSGTFCRSLPLVKVFSGPLLLSYFAKALTSVRFSSVCGEAYPALFGLALHQPSGSEALPPEPSVMRS